MDLKPEQIFDYIELIATASIDLSKWQQVLKHGESLFGASASFIQGIDRFKAKGEFALINGYSDNALTVYQEEFLSKDKDICVRQLRYLKALQPFSDYTYFPPDTFQKHDFYAFNRDYAGVQHMIGMKIHENLNQHWGVGWKFDHKGPKPDDEYLAVLSILGPHFKHAVDLSFTFCQQQRYLDSIMDTLSWHNYAVAVLNAEMRVLFANKSMDDIMNSQEFFRNSNKGILDAYDQEGWARVCQSVSAIIRCQERERYIVSDPVHILVDKNCKAHYRITITFLPEDTSTLFEFKSELKRKCLLLLTKVEVPSKPPYHLLMEQFGLTRSQAKLAAALYDGTHLKMAAHQLGISYGTARAHLLRVFEKTGVHRQVELVRLLQDSRFVAYSHR
ncbi:helix-turn-helix transcriptional regulator [Kordiimonas sp.]|uniref:helix-turn-helix transcriptional regulator n=1 Tax=Kordiimonas sp. TaxID=1970157 RepID=UPI003A93F911